MGESPKLEELKRRLAYCDAHCETKYEMQWFLGRWAQENYITFVDAALVVTAVTDSLMRQINVWHTKTFVVPELLDVIAECQNIEGSEIIHFEAISLLEDNTEDYPDEWPQLPENLRRVENVEVAEDPPLEKLKQRLTFCKASALTVSRIREYVLQLGKDGHFPEVKFRKEDLSELIAQSLKEWHADKMMNLELLDIVMACGNINNSENVHDEAIGLLESINEKYPEHWPKRNNAT